YVAVKEPTRSADQKPAPAQLNTPARVNALLAERAAPRGLRHASEVRPFDEFIKQRLLPRRINGQAPALASADVNGDGQADVFVSGGAGQAGVLFLGAADGSFAPAASQPWKDAAGAD